MPGWLIWIAGIAIATIEVVCLDTLGWYLGSLHTPLAIVVLLAVYRSFEAGATILAALLLPFEWLAAAPPGYYSLGLVVTFLTIYALQRRVRTDQGAFDRFAVGGAALLHPLVVGLTLLGLESPESRPQLVTWSVLISVLVLPVVIGPMRSALHRLDDAFESSAVLRNR